MWMGCNLRRTVGKSNTHDYWYRFTHDMNIISTTGNNNLNILKFYLTFDEK